MRRQPFRIWIVGRKLNRCKIVNIHSLRNNDDTAGMLSGRFFDPFTTGRYIQTISLFPIIFQPELFQITADITECCLLGNSTDRTGTIDIFITEQDFGISMRFFPDNRLRNLNRYPVLYHLRSQGTFQTEYHDRHRSVNFRMTDKSLAGRS